ncbi:MAG: N-acetylglucosamine-6-phosphate deacetylase [Acidisphaera sp.]|nr:N-acetylglucosamine-6-phosphate deacetylase [Acidisphaera sp.]MBV9811177.1 N-acetylglucosamine-6-phosphate deacetylase [Acetobacteraceae bacterium]
MTGLFASRIFDGLGFRPGGTVLIEGQCIAGIVDGAERATARLPDGAILAPGFVDLQVNGGGGAMFNDAPDGAMFNGAMLARIAGAHAADGTTSIVPTLISGSRRAIDAAMACVRDASDCAAIAGLHVEGPFIARLRRGIHPQAALRALGAEDLAQLIACAAAGHKLLLTVAPEEVAPSTIAALARAGVAVFLGHSDATFEQAAAALAAGARGFTHLFNAMSPFASRAPGLVGAALADASAHAGVIADGHHVHPAALRVAYRALGPARLFLVSDAMATAGSDISGFDLYGVPIRLAEGRLTDAAGTLAGAHLTLASAVRYAVASAGIPLADALRMATSTPAAALVLADRGRIAPGQRADMVALDASLAVVGVWQGGHAG